SPLLFERAVGDFPALDFSVGDDVVFLQRWRSTCGQGRHTRGEDQEHDKRSRESPTDPKHSLNPLIGEERRNRNYISTAGQGKSRTPRSKRNTPPAGGVLGGSRRTDLFGR